MLPLADSLSYEYLRLNLMQMRKIWNYNLPVNEVHACELLPSYSLYNELQTKRIETQMGTQVQSKTHIRIQTHIIQRMHPETTNKPTLLSSGGRARDVAFLFPRYNEMQAGPLRFLITIISTAYNENHNFSQLFHQQACNASSSPRHQRIPQYLQFSIVFLIFF